MIEVCKCGNEIEWEGDFDYPDVICSGCGIVYRMFYDEAYDGEEEYGWFWLEPKE